MQGKRGTFKLSTWVFALSLLSTQVYAYDPKGDHFNFVPDVAQRFAFSITPIALAPSATNLNYVIYNKALPLQMPRWTEKELTPGYSFAFKLGARYLFPSGQDIALDWTHMNNSTSSSIDAPNNLFFLGPDYEIGPNAGTIRRATGNANFKYDVVNLSAGQTLIFGKNFAMRVFGGISDAYLREQVNSTYYGVAGGIYPGNYQTAQMVTANFTGIGPRVGLDAGYQWNNGFGFFGEGAASALIGAAYAKSAYLSASPELTTVFGVANNYQSISDKRIAQIVPGFDTRFGLSYAREYQSGMIMKVEAGYQAAVYINAINQYLPASLVDGTDLSNGGIFVATMSHTISNYNVQGPFLQATLAIV